MAKKPVQGFTFVEWLLLYAMAGGAVLIFLTLAGWFASLAQRAQLVP